MKNGFFLLMMGASSNQFIQAFNHHIPIHHGGGAYGGKVPFVSTCTAGQVDGRQQQNAGFISSYFMGESMQAANQLTGSRDASVIHANGSSLMGKLVLGIPTVRRANIQLKEGGPDKNS